MAKLIALTSEAARRDHARLAADKLYDDLMKNPPKQTAFLAMRIDNIEAMKALAGVQ